MSTPTQATLQHTAVLFLVFNRPQTTARVLAAIRAARPPRLYVACDGPRAHAEGERDTVEALRCLVLEGVDWPCEVFTLFREDNLGCRNAVSQAITWFFQHEEEGIILEDDCLPSASFFPFCETLLEKYRHDDSIAGITGDFRMPRELHPPNTIGLVGYSLIWGWASWRRVWEQYKVELEDWKGDLSILPSLANKPSDTRAFFTRVFDAVTTGELNTWDFQFTYLVIKSGRSFVHPFVNLITNIGFSTGATHTAEGRDPSADLPRGEVAFPLEGPVTDPTYENWLDRNIFTFGTLASRIKRRLMRMVGISPRFS
jgi:hypothetical protein